MKIKSIVLLAVALGCGFVAMLGVQQILSGDKAEAADGSAQVLVATVEILPGLPLDETNTEFKKVAAETVSDGLYVTNEAEFKERALRVRAFPGEMIMLSKLTEPGDGGISAVIPHGMRIVTVKCDATMIASGMIRAGDRVDILLTYKSQGPDRKTISRTRTVLKYIEVFSTDNVREVNETDARDVKAKNICFLVTPEQAQVVNKAKDMGNLDLSLRKKTDDENVDIPSISNNDLDDFSSFGEQNDDEAGGVRKFIDEELQQQDPEPEETAAVEPETPQWTIHIYSGNEHREEQVDLPEEPAAAAALDKPLGALWNKFFKGS